MLAMMDVYLVPTGGEHFELYCEPASADEPVAPEGITTGWRAKLSRTFHEVLAAVEREHDAPAPETGGWMSRWRARAMRWLAEKVAEQRLLWRLRGKSQVTVHYPAGLVPTAVMGTIRGILSSDADRHRRWLVIDALGMLGSLVLVPLPGPNVPGYYFTFRVVGHFLAMRGAQHGLSAVTWNLEAQPLLAELGRLPQLPREERHRRLHAIASELGLDRLARFVERMMPGVA
jgi:hypothetical protein